MLSSRDAGTHFSAWAVISSPLILSFNLTDAHRMARAWPIVSNRAVLAARPKMPELGRPQLATIASSENACFRAALNTQEEPCSLLSEDKVLHACCANAAHYAASNAQATTSRSCQLLSGVLLLR